MCVDRMERVRMFDLSFTYVFSYNFQSNIVRWALLFIWYRWADIWSREVGWLVVRRATGELRLKSRSPWFPNSSLSPPHLSHKQWWVRWWPVIGVRLEDQREAIAVGQRGVLRTCIEEVGIELEWKRKECKTYEETVILSGGWLAMEKEKRDQLTMISHCCSFHHKLYFLLGPPEMW